MKQTPIGKTPEQMLREAEKLRRSLPRLLGGEVVNFALENFKVRGFVSAPGKIDPWPARKNDKSRRALLVKTGKLRRSIRIERATASGNDILVVVAAGGSEAPYAGIHNDGGRIFVRKTEKSVAYFWAMYKKTKDPRWKAMALSKRGGFTVKMPQRKFLGGSTALERRIEFIIRQKVLQIIQ